MEVGIEPVDTNTVTHLWRWSRRRQQGKARQLLAGQHLCKAKQTHVRSGPDVAPAGQSLPVLQTLLQVARPHQWEREQRKQAAVSS